MIYLVLAIFLLAIVPSLVGQIIANAFIYSTRPTATDLKGEVQHYWDELSTKDKTSFQREHKCCGLFENDNQTVVYDWYCLPVNADERRGPCADQFFQNLYQHEITLLSLYSFGSPCITAALLFLTLLMVNYYDYIRRKPVFIPAESDSEDEEELLLPKDSYYSFIAS
ncbi:hypothetical protein MP638_000081 [Amoeboaphelidium occidentale]|nr:hypothetical protein MP638_000081 [Amoeboaphelidium occidentale]